jgi:hypothetical protein
VRADLDRKIEWEKSGTRGEPEREIRLWAGTLAEADAKRVRFQHAYIEGIISLEDLKARLAELDDTCTTAEQDILALEGRLEHVRLCSKTGTRYLSTLWPQRQKSWSVSIRKSATASTR